MKIYLNGVSQDISDNASVADLLALLDLGGQRLAVEINKDIVPRSSFAEHRLQAGDKVEIVHAIGGG
jgi:sulfur carrier protein